MGTTVTNTAQYNTGVGANVFNALNGGGDNVAIGYDGLGTLQGGGSNVAIGSNALRGVTGGDNNVGVGYAAGKSITGSSNVTIGHQAGNDWSTGSGNSAGVAITSGSDNVIIGKDADASIAAASNQIVIGANVTGGGDNTVLLGNGSITNWLPTDDNEVDLGSSSKEMKNVYVDGVTYTDAVGFGTVVMTLPTADGSDGQILKTDGSGTLSWTTNVSGASSLDALSDVLHNTSASNLVVGHIPGNITSGTSNSAFSRNGLEDLTTGLYNNAFGWGALKNVTTSWYNTAMGHKAMELLVDGASNTGFGYQAMNALTTGGNNTAVGDNAGSGNATGNYNTSVGKEALQGSGNNSSNTAVGFQAGQGITTGADNVFVGKSAGNTIDDGSSNVVIGDDADVSATNSSNQIVIGQGATGQGDNYAVIGNANVTRVYAAQDGAAVLYADATINSSDERLKENIKPLTHGLEFINKLNPVSYDKMKVSDFLSNKKPKELKFEIGLLAQEVKEISEELDFDNRIVTVGENGIHRMDYQKIMMPLVKAIQEQQEMIESLREEMEILK